MLRVKSLHIVAEKSRSANTTDTSTATALEAPNRGNVVTILKRGLALRNL